jgi:ATP-dependent helicase HrpB
LRLERDVTSRHPSDIDQILASDLDYMGRRLRDQLLQSTPYVRVSAKGAHALEKGLLLSYCDRVARRRGDILLLSDGNSARLHTDSLARHNAFVVAIEVEQRSQEGLPVVRLASAIEPDWLLEYFPDRIETREELIWNREAERVEQVSVLQYENLAIDETSTAPRDTEAAAALLAAKALEAGIERFADAEELNRFLRRLRFVQQHATNLHIPADVVDSGFRQLASGLTSFRELRDAARDGGLLSIIHAGLPMRLIDEIAPTHVILPSGRRARVEYHQDQPPSVASRLQDFFGMTETPAVAHGSVPLVVQLLAPNHRPVQVTTDLPSFWKNLYPQLRRELGRRYPKHAWPEDPESVLRG